MKKSVKIIYLSISLLVFLFLATDIAKAVTVIGKAITGETVTGEAVTGEATRTINMNITVLAVPTLSIISPKSGTYLINESLLLNYSVSGQNSIWYNLDNLENITITSPIFFNASEGSHTLYLYANNSQGTTSKNVTLSVNTTRFIIQREEFNSSTKGSSTEFNIYTYEELQNLSGIILENTQSGKILFNQEINLTDDTNPADNLINIDNNVNISFKRIEINSTSLPNFNKSATLWFYNLTFSNPRILKNGEACPSSICTKESYLNGILKFNVTGFSIYTAEETPAATAPSTTSSGGGGGVISSRELGLEITPELIEVMVKKGETVKLSIKVKNNRTLTQEFKVEVLYLQDSVSIQSPEFSLKPGEEKDVILIFSPPDSLKEGTYAGKIKISSEWQKKEIPVIFSLKSKIVLFDLTLIIPTNYKEVRPGGDVLFQISIFNLGGGGKEDVEITYYIKDFEGNTIVEQKGIVGVETQASFSRIITLPKDIAEGQYIIGANARYDSSIGTTSDIFYVSKLEISLIKKFIPITIISFVVLIILIVLFILLMIIHFKRKIKGLSKNYEEELDKIEKRIRGRNLKLAEAIKIEEKLKLQLVLLNKAYEKNYITKSSYEIGKAKIKKAYDILKEKYL